MSQPSDKILKNEYLSRLNRTIDYIHSHSHEDLNLDRLADVACFSKYHFHRIFKAILGETANEYVQRIRLEKALSQLILNKFKSITEIALDCGFSSSQNFARSFKARYGITPTHVRAEYGWDSTLRQMEKIKGRAMDKLQLDEKALSTFNTLQRQISLERILARPSKMQVTVKKHPPYRVAYVRSWGPYDVEAGLDAFTRLLQWAGPRGLVNDKALLIGLVSNSPDVTPAEKLIYDACITVPESTEADRWVNIQLIPGGDFAVHHCEIDIYRQEDEWTRLVLDWLTQSEYQPDDRPYYSIYYNTEEPFAIKNVIADFCLPVKPLMR
ncbi:MAG: AraC family transcriptional regulator [Deltaproteobacteria bacterium]|jgi:AraC family transcriptional regulator|nr:AraC family transcriptional regulator [Deltaproteobacteria bacterium]